MPLKHGKYKRPEYVVWERMRSRCNNPKDKNYHSYGGRGITVCPEWDDFNVFLEDMGDRPEGMSIDRRDNNSGYSKGNCRWITLQEQNHNTSRSINIEWKGATKTLRQWAEVFSLDYRALWYRHSKGVVPPELFAPIGTFGNKTIRRSV